MWQRIPHSVMRPPVARNPKPSPIYHRGWSLSIAGVSTKFLSENGSSSSSSASGAACTGGLGGLVGPAPALVDVDEGFASGRGGWLGVLMLSPETSGVPEGETLAFSVATEIR